MRDGFVAFCQNPLEEVLVFCLLTGIYLFIGKFVAGPVVIYTRHFMGTWYYNFVVGYLSALWTDRFIPFC